MCANGVIDPLNVQHIMGLLSRNYPGNVPTYSKFPTVSIYTQLYMYIHTLPCIKYVSMKFDE